MDVFIVFMGMVVNFMRTPLFIWGFQFSYWDVFLYVIIGFLVFRFIGGVFE